MKTARDYQLKAIDGIHRALANHPSTICVMATGLGKSYVIARVASEWRSGNVLVLAPRIELVDQLADTLAAELGFRPAIEQGERGIDPGDLFASGSIIVGTVQSMITENRMRKFRHHPFGLVVLDECHRAASPSFAKLLDTYRNQNPFLKWFGVTATPNRTDGAAMGLAFDSVAFDMGIVDGIDLGWLVDIHQKFAVIENLDLSKVKLTRNEFGEVDFNQSELQALLTEEGPLHEMSRPLLDMTTDGTQAIVFTASVSHAHLWAAVLNSYRPGCAAAIDGSMPKGEGMLRTELVKRYKANDLQFLLNFGIATEGFDAPRTGIVAMGRPTKSILVKTQMLGRGTRPLPGVVDGIPTAPGRRDAIAASAKPWATVLDFVGNSKHRLVTASDVLGGDYDVDIRELADDIIGAQRNGNVRDAITKAKASMLLEAEEAKREPLRSVVKATGLQYRLEDVGLFNGVPATTRKPAIARGGATDGQIQALIKMGVKRETAIGYSKKQAGAVIDKMRGGKCTEGQQKVLRKFGFDPAQFDARMASKQIQAIADNGWRWG